MTSAHSDLADSSSWVLPPVAPALETLISQGSEEIQVRLREQTKGRQAASVNLRFSAGSCGFL